MNAIGDFFRTAVLIDDRVNNDYRKLDPLQTEEPSAQPAEELSDEPEPGLIEPTDDGQTPVYPSKLVSAFLAENVVCSVIEFGPDSDLVDLALRSAKIADLVILDWLINGSYAATVSAIDAIAAKNRGRLTVIVVFTGEEDLEKVGDRLKDHADFDPASAFLLKRDSTIVLVFGKPGITRSDGQNHRTAEYRDLPRIIREDLEMVFKGLMPEFAFHGINVLREATPRILASFGPDLDIGALVHRALLPEPSDAGSQFARLLATDFEQAMQEKRVDEAWNDEVIEQFLEDKPLNKPEALAKRLRDTQGVPANLRQLDDENLVRKAVALGLLKAGIGKANKSLAKQLIDSLDGAAGSSKALAALMSSVPLRDVAPRLELGVVVRDQSDNYWLCIQPLCDSVRINQTQENQTQKDQTQENPKRAFPMMPLKVKGENRTDAMIQTADGNFVRAGFEHTPYKVTMPQFVPTDAGEVVAACESSNWQFKCDGGDIYTAVARLRPEVAMAAVQGFASQASRVGVDTSEWLRVGAPKPSPTPPG